MKDNIIDRIRELQAQRASWVERLQQLAQDTEQARHMLSAFDGAIGELSRLAEDTEDSEGGDDGTA